MQRLWADIIGDPDAPERGGLCMDQPTSQRRFLGCEHVESHIDLEDGAKILGMEYNMEPFFRGCLDRWTEVTGQPWQDLPNASTPFLDEDTLRRSHNVGPLGRKLAVDCEGGSSKKKKAKVTRGMKAKSLAEDSGAEDPDKVPSGVLQPVAASLLTQVLYGARFARPDLLRAVAFLARKMTRWREMQD